MDNEYDTQWIIQDIVSDESDIELCDIHNKPYTLICKNDKVYCEKCECDILSMYAIDGWKKQTLLQMKNFEDKLNNKIKGLNCIAELLNNREIIKQIDDIIDTIYVDISHIYNFNKIINDNDLPISNIIKRKNKILNSNTIIQIEFDNDISIINIINIIISNDANIHAHRLRRVLA
jgi:hypothetical protein